jgi:hypothetical protein
MIFVVLVGGLSPFEGPMLGALILFFDRTFLRPERVWYLIGLGRPRWSLRSFATRGSGYSRTEFRYHLRVRGSNLRINEAPVTLHNNANSIPSDEVLDRV